MRTRLTPSSAREIDAGRVRAVLDGRALVTNYEAIRSQVDGLGMIPMIKADAYGHGAAWAARLLHGAKDLYAYGVASLGEGGLLREQIGPRHRRTPVMVFSGAMPWCEETGAYCEENGLQPVIGSEDAWRAFTQGRWQERIGYHLEFDTGMNRVGLAPALSLSIAKQVSLFSSEAQPLSVFTHLASSEVVEDPITQRQLSRYLDLRGVFESRVPGARFHLANSGAIWNSKYFRLSEISDLVRPGLSLYGIPPWSGAPVRGLCPAMTVYARVIHCFDAAPGETIGYGGTFRVKGTEKQKVAVLAIGYADGLLRALSNLGEVWLGGRKENLLGQISMDLAAVSRSSQVAVGAEAELLGPNIDIWAQSKKAGTIPYELLTSFSARVIREDG